VLIMRLWNYIRGYIVILVDGVFIEKFINICARRQILLWDINKQNATSTNMSISIKGFKMLRAIVRKSGCKARIVRKIGLPFLIHKYKYRKLFYLGMIVFCIILYSMTMFIWKIEISGNKQINSQDVLIQLRSLGVDVGKLKYKINANDIANEMMIKSNQFSWVGVTIKGTKLKIQVAERGGIPQLVAKNVPCDIVAKKDGIVESIITKAGTAMVKSGDAVTKGQVLISSKVEVYNSEPNLVHAIGSVEARTKYEGSNVIETSVVNREKTGHKVRKIYVVLFGKEFKPCNPSIEYKDFDTKEHRNIKFGTHDSLFLFNVADYYEVKVSYKSIKLEEAKKIAIDKTYFDILKKIPIEAKKINRQINYTQDANERLSVNVVVECIEQIELEMKI